MSANSLSPARELATNLETESGPILRLVTSPESKPRAGSAPARERERRVLSEGQRELDVLGGVIRAFPNRGAQVIFVDDWDSLSEQESQSVVDGAPVAVPVGLDVYDIPAETQEVIDIVGGDIRRGQLLAYLPYLNPLRARAVELYYGLGEEPEHSLRQVGQRIGVSTAAAKRLVSEGTRQLRRVCPHADI